jgi:hypothetical protein
MLTMRCSHCGQERPLEEFELGMARQPLSDELQMLARFQRDPVHTCRQCYRPNKAVAALDRVLAQDDETTSNSTLDVLADWLDWFRRRWS